MKQLTYIIALLATTGLSSKAQIAAGLVGASVVNNSIVAPDVTIKATFKNNSGEISWHAAKRLSVRRYELEKSSDGQRFSYVTSVAGHNSAFSFTDNNILENINYYRIKIVAADGSFMYSKVTTLDTKKNAGEIRILQTQINQKLFIWLPANTSINKVLIADASGRTVVVNAAVTNSTNLAAVETANLTAGLYSIKLQTNKGETIKLKFNKLIEVPVTVSVTAMATDLD